MMLFRSPSSETKLKFAIFIGMTQFHFRKCMGKRVYKPVGRLYERLTDAVFATLN
jgi:hypothetical protein